MIVRSWPFKKAIIFGGKSNISAQSSPNLSSTSYRVVDKVHQGARTTHVVEKRLGGNGQFRSWDIVYSRFVAGGRKHLLRDDQLSLWPSDSAQIFQYLEAILVSPVMENFAKDED